MREEIETIYGYHPVNEALKNPRRKLHRLIATLNSATRIMQEAKKRNIEPDIVHPRFFDQKLGKEIVHQGLLLEAQALEQPCFDQLDSSKPLVLLDQITDPHNVGAIMRSCAAFGIGGLITTARHSPEASAVLFKAASGAYEHVPLIKITNLARTMKELQNHGHQLLGFDSEAPLSLGDFLSQTIFHRPFACVMGAEGKGLRRLTRENCDFLIRLEIPGTIISLNVSNALAIALYNLTRT